MTTHLRNYISNKLISLGTVVLIIVGSWLYFGFNQTQWQFLLIALITFGYGHFIVGWIYQCKSFFRKENVKQQFIVFAFLAIISWLTAIALFTYVGVAFAILAGFVYFLLHGFFNEQTLIKREAKLHVPLSYIGSLAIFSFSMLAYAVPDPTFLFDRTLTFLPANNFFLIQTFLAWNIDLAIFTQIFWVGMALTFGILLYSWLRSRHTALTIFLFIAYALSILAVLQWGAPTYVYMYIIVIGYHFMTWFLFYFREMKKRPGPAFLNFNLIHALVFLPFLVSGWFFFTDNMTAVTTTILDYNFFVIAAYVHITTSFMNDGWFQKIQDRVFGN